MLLNEEWLGVESLLVLSTFVVKGRGRNKQRKRHKDKKKRGKNRGNDCKGFYWDANQSFKWFKVGLYSRDILKF